jgi:phospholipase/carboxylesterase
MHQKNIRTAGKDLSAGNKVLIMVHGRGANAEDILSLAQDLNVKDFTLLAPQADENTWYPYSFLAPPSQNEPWLSSAIGLLAGLVEELQGKGVPAENIYFTGFSQGACLTLEFVARHANRYGGVVAFTGGLIGDKIYNENFAGDFNGTPVFIGSSDPDPHVPPQRVQATALVLEKMGANVTVKIYSNMGHTINADEIENANRLVFK